VRGPVERRRISSRERSEPGARTEGQAIPKSMSRRGLRMVTGGRPASMIEATARLARGQANTYVKANASNKLRSRQAHPLRPFTGH